MDYKIEVSSRKEAEQLEQFDFDGFVEWDKRLAYRNPYIIGYNRMMSEVQKQWGARAGVNTGNGMLEGSMPADLFLALGSQKGPHAGNPDWFKDDKLFYQYLRAHPEHDARPGKHRSQGEKYVRV